MGFNADKPEVATHLRLTKANAIRSIRPKAIILGSSRAERGLDPDHLGWNRNAKPRYNLAFVSANIHEVRRYLEHAQHYGPIQQAVIGLDFFMFNASHGNRPDFRDSRLAGSGNGSGFQGRVQDILETLFSHDALRSSWATVGSGPGVTRSRPYLPNGQVAWDFGAERVKKAGYRNASLEAERAYLQSITGFSFVDSNGHSTLEDFREIVCFARRERIDLRLFISPVHARMLELKRFAGLWPHYERWKRELVAVLAQDAASHPQLRPIPLWDFSGYGEVTIEALPPSGGNHARMKYFWESSHYRKEVGDMMLDKIFTGKEGPVPGFGVLLDSGNIESYLSAVRMRGIGYQRTHSAELEELRREWTSPVDSQAVQIAETVHGSREKTTKEAMQ